MTGEQAKAALDAHVREMMQWHFSPETGCRYWLDQASRLGWDPRDVVRVLEEIAPALDPVIETVAEGLK